MDRTGARGSAGGVKENAVDDGVSDDRWARTMTAAEIEASESSPVTKTFAIAPDDFQSGPDPTMFPVDLPASGRHPNDSSVLSDEDWRLGKPFPADTTCGMWARPRKPFDTLPTAITSRLRREKSDKQPRPKQGVAVITLAVAMYNPGCASFVAAYCRFETTSEFLAFVDRTRKSSSLPAHASPSTNTISSASGHHVLGWCHGPPAPPRARQHEGGVE